MITKEELDFLRESNNIEDEWDDKSLEDSVLAWEFCKDQPKLTPMVIRETHKILMRTRKTISEIDKGTFRTGKVFIGGKEAKPWFVVPELIEEWLHQVHLTLKTGKKTAEQNCKNDHIMYESVHPFFDGNGRSGRIFYNWERLKMGLPIHIILAKTKHENYYPWFI